ncbi:MAG: membrane protein insertase YidC [Polyangiales bacterium]
MDDRKQPPFVLMLLPLIALGAVLAVQYFSPPKAQTDTPDGASQAPAPQIPEQSDASGPPQPSAVESQAREESQKIYKLEGDRFIASFTNLNTAMTSLRVKGERYHDQEGNPSELVTTDKEQYLPLAPAFSGVSIPRDSHWTAVDASDKRIRFEWTGDDFVITRTWELGDSPYQLLSTIEIRNTGSSVRSVDVGIRSAHYIRRQDEKGGFFGRASPALSHGICEKGDETIREDRKGLLSEDESHPLQPHTYGPDVQFVALSNVYFAIVAAPEDGSAERCELLATDRGGTPKDPEGSLFEAELVYAPQTIAPGQTATFGTSVYAGPKDYDALEKFGHHATQIINLGWFSFIAHGMSWLLRAIYGIVGNWGLAIILLTLLVRVLLLPFVVPQFRNMAKQRALKPEIDRINELYKDDREKKGAAMMELWRKHKVNPLGGCLPVLLQMPIFFALYQTLSTSIELYHAPFVLWWSDLSSPDPYYVLPIILGSLMFVQQKLTPVQMDPTQAKVMLYAMPLMMTFFMLLLPTGLCLYMVTSSAVGITQQRYMYWRMDHEPALSEAVSQDEDGEPNDPAAEEGAAAPKRGQSRRKKRTRRGRA